jgi:hypothetical protein
MENESLLQMEVSTQTSQQFSELKWQVENIPWDDRKP